MLKKKIRHIKKIFFLYIIHISIHYLLLQVHLTGIYALVCTYMCGVYHRSTQYVDCIVITVRKALTRQEQSKRYVIMYI